MFKLFYEIVTTSPKCDQILFPNILGGDCKFSCSSEKLQFQGEIQKRNYEDKSQTVHGTRS